MRHEVEQLPTLVEDDLPGADSVGDEVPAPIADDAKGTPGDA
jgi:hypothetical protein